MTLQLVLGPSAVIISILGQEFAAHALAYAPASELSWYIGLGVFGPLRWADDILGFDLDVQHSQLCFVGLPLLFITAAWLRSNRLLLIAIADGLALLYVCFLAAIQIHPLGSGPWRLSEVRGSPMLFTLFICALLSFIASHIIYWRAIHREHACTVNRTSPTPFWP